MSSSRPQPQHSSSSFGNGASTASFLGAFGRRPRTATNSRDRQGLPTGTGSDYAASTDDLRNISNQPVNRSRMSLVARSGLPRSNSSSQVNRITSPDSGNSPSRLAFPSNGNASGEANRRSGMVSSPSSSNVRNQMSGSGEPLNGSGFPSMIRTNSSQGPNGGVSSGSGGGGGNAIGRYLRRYSQGAGKNMAAANEAYSAASAYQTNNAQSDAVGSSSNNQSGRGSALTASQTLAVLPSTSSHNAQGLSNAEGATASLALMNSNHDSGNGAMRNAAITPSTPNNTTEVRSTHRIRLVPHLEATRSLHFEPIERDLVEGSIAVKIGRFTDRASPSSSSAVRNNAESVPAAPASGVVGGDSSMFGSTAAGGSTLSPTSSAGVPGARGGAIPSSAGGGGRVDSGRVAFKSKVVSRGHAEIWCEAGGKFFIRDTKSSSGTFLNHIRLSHPNIESKSFPVKDGDVVQLGVDYQGGTEEIYRCVKMRVELNRGWQRGANQFNVNALRQLRALQGSPLPEPGAGKTAATTGLPTNRQSMNVTDCCICLFSVTVCQALFIAPCSHVFHFKCIRPLIEQHHPGFSCPLCRTFADLNADVEEDEAWQQTLLQEAQAGVGATSNDADIRTPMVEDVVSPFSNMHVINPNSPLASLPQDTVTSSGTPLLPSSADTPLDLTASGHALRNVVSPMQRSSTLSLDEREEDDEEELMYDAPMSTQTPPLLPSAPININTNTTGSSNHHRTPSPPHHGFTTSPNFNDARTPLNNHFLSTLAEGLPANRGTYRANDVVGESTLIPRFFSAENRADSSEHDQSALIEGEGAHDLFSTPARVNSPLAGTSPVSATAQSHTFDDDGSGISSTAPAFTTAKGKSPDTEMPLSQGGGNHKQPNQQQDVVAERGTGVLAATSSGRVRDPRLRDSNESSERESSENRSQTSDNREAHHGTPSKVTRFFKRSSNALAE
ncbi:hypothetical protein CBS101457_001964 [Exobasidium rhododendri]|nr:hypothetical protein CBS101457_001964 [Exobasidium rhododendri]